MVTALLESYTRSKHQLSFVFGVDDLRFTTSLWYYDVDFYQLEDTYGKEYMDRIYFHIAVFEMGKLQSLKPDYIDLGEYKKYHTKELEELWMKNFIGAYSQWLYENDLPDYRPVFLHKAQDSAVEPIETAAPDGPELLSLNGGGKDSLVCMIIFDKIGAEYASVGYSGSIYGKAQPQLQLIRDQVENCTKSKMHHQISAYDDLMDCPYVQLNDSGIKTLYEDETARSIVAILPVVLQYRYRYANLGHEKSAEYPNLIWEKNGMAINHQFCKSIEEQMIFDGYIRKNLISNFKIFSVLKPIADVIVFSLLNSYGSQHLRYTHSCNVTKPWCKRCPKCAYVWLGYMAALPTNLVDSIFNKENLLDLPENQIHYRQMLGLEKHNAFECVGQIDESRLFFEIIRRKGLTGNAMDTFTNEVSERFDGKKETAIMRLTEVDDEYDQIPEKFSAKVMDLLKKQMTVARNNLLETVLN